MSAPEKKAPMAKNVIRMSVVGTDAEAGFVRPEDFIAELQNLIGIVNRVDRDLSGGESTMYLRIIELALQSPPTITCEACVRPKAKADIRDAVINKAAQLIGRLEKEETFDESLDNQLLDYLVGFAKPIGTRVASVRIEASQHASNVTSALRHQLTKVVTPEGTYQGFMRGDLQYINIHGETRKLRVYPTAGPYLDCQFSDELYAAAISGVGKRVEVRGVLHYREAAKFPHAMEVESIEVFPPEEDLPTFTALRGISPDMTGDMLSEDFVRQVRDRD